MSARIRGLSLAEARSRGQGSAHLDADPTYARLFVRRVSPYLSWLISSRTALSADAVTATSIVAGTAGGLLSGIGAPATALLAVALLQLAYLLDVVDGEVARIRGTAGLRGTYLDLIGHHIQNRALYLGSGWLLITVTGGAWWAIAAAILTAGFATPFGHYARLHVAGGAGIQENPEHARPEHVGRPPLTSPRIVRWTYRRLSFVWSYPASMNVFSIALLVDAARGFATAEPPLAVPALMAVFGPTLVVKQIVHALRLLRASAWTASSTG